jgi:hypothetical protein
VVGKMKESASNGRCVACRTLKSAVERSAAKAAWPSLLRYRSVPVVPSAFVYGTGTLTGSTSLPGNLVMSSPCVSPTSGTNAAM